MLLENAFVRKDAYIVEWRILQISRNEHINEPIPLVGQGEHLASRH